MIKLFLNKSEISKGSLILINPSHPLKEELNKECLTVLPGAFNIALEKQAAKMLMGVMSLLGCKWQITPVSGYRSLQEQQRIYEESMREHGWDFTSKYVAVPGCSEHQTGLAIDLAEDNSKIDFLCPHFPYTGICGQFRELSVRYGFIERYPAGQEKITHIAHEPWHFRYVGYPHSVIMQEKAMTLEEYTEYLKQFQFYGSRLCLKHDKRDFEIFYVPISSGAENVIEIPEGTPYQISGNNDGGVVVTLWREAE